MQLQNQQQKQIRASDVFLQILDAANFMRSQIHRLEQEVAELKMELEINGKSKSE
jgi:ribosome biogenesis GTPase A